MPRGETAWATSLFRNVVLLIKRKKKRACSVLKYTSPCFSKLSINDIRSFYSTKKINKFQSMWFTYRTSHIAWMNFCSVLKSTIRYFSSFRIRIILACTTCTKTLSYFKMDRETNDEETEVSWLWYNCMLANVCHKGRSEGRSNGSEDQTRIRRCDERWGTFFNLKCRKHNDSLT